MPALTRRFHVSDLLAAVMKSAGASQRGFVGLLVLRCYMAGWRPVPDAALAVVLDEVRAYEDDFAAAVVAAYPEFGAFLAHTLPPVELLGVWRRRREREFGRYLPAPLLPATHPLRRRRPPRTAPECPDAPPSGTAPSGTVRGELAEACGWYARSMRAAPAPHAPGTGGAAERGRGPRRQFHIGDLLSVVMDRDVAPRGVRGVIALLRYMAGPSAADPEGLFVYLADFRAAVLAAHPVLETYDAADEPVAELRDVWLRRRECEFGRYLTAPRLPASHPLRAAPPTAGAAGNGLRPDGAERAGARGRA